MRSGVKVWPCAQAPARDRSNRGGKISYGALAAFVGADAHHFLERQDEDLAVADLARLAALMIASTARPAMSSTTAISILIFGRKSTVYSLPR